MYKVMEDQQEKFVGEDRGRLSGLDESRPTMEKSYKPSRNEILRDNEISLRFLSGRGMVVRVGCKEIAFEDSNKGMEELTKYINNPYEEQKKWNKIFNDQ